MQTVAIIPKRSKPEALALAGAVAAWLGEHGHTALVEEPFAVAGATTVSGDELAARAELVVVLGGDGTLLHAARLCRQREVPILGVNLGSLGFMTEVPREQALVALEATLAGRYGVERRPRLVVRLIRRGAAVLEGVALNDAVLSKNALARIAEIVVTVGGAHLTTFRADGVIISTPTGSSAYGLAAGGPLVHPAVPAVVLTPICPHTLTQRPIVLPDSLPLTFELLSESEMFVTIDGQTGMALERGDRLEVERAAAATLLVRGDHAGWFAVLRDKLRWNER